MYYYNLFNMDIADLTSYRFLSRCPNFGNYSFKKPVRTEDEAEWLQFYIKNVFSTDISSSSDSVGAIGLYIETF